MTSTSPQPAPVHMVRKLWSVVFVCPAGHQHRSRKAADNCKSTKAYLKPTTPERDQ
jgi:hypothetical protein